MERRKWLNFRGPKKCKSENNTCGRSHKDASNQNKLEFLQLQAVACRCLMWRRTQLRLERKLQLLCFHRVPRQTPHILAQVLKEEEIKIKNEMISVEAISLSEPRGAMSECWQGLSKKRWLNLSNVTFKIQIAILTMSFIIPVVIHNYILGLDLHTAQSSFISTKKTTMRYEPTKWFWARYSVHNNEMIHV